MDSPHAPADSFPVVGIGASVGALDAFTRLIRQLPAKPNLAILLVQHLDPTHPSLLVEILSRETTLSIVEAVDGMPIEVDHIIVIPPDTRMGADGGMIRLQPRGDRLVPHLPVDFLFRSLAEGFGPRAVAVVLSGGGTDGTLGLGDIREVGGATFAQDEASANEAAMPMSAALTGNVDAVLTPEGIADALVRLAGRPDLFIDRDADHGESVTGRIPDDESLTPLLSLLHARTGIDFNQYKQNTIRRRIARRLALKKLSTVEELVAAVRNDPKEWPVLSRDLLIGVTRFFRDPEVFDRLQTIAIPALLNSREPQAALRVWVPGCSTGEEVYSLAIVLLEATQNLPDVTLKILATDVNEESLAFARAGVYPENIAVDVSPERLRKYFRKTLGGYQINPVVRDLCAFARHDLSSDPPFGWMDLISCRNVLIYFDAPLQRRVFPLFHFALRPGGYLLLGSSESIGQFTDLFGVDTDRQLYARLQTTSRPPTSVTVGGPSWGRSPTIPFPAPIQPPRHTGNLIDIQREADRLLARYAPAGVLVDSNLTILQFRGDTSPYLQHPTGTAGLDLMRMAQVGLRADLQSGIEAVRSKGVAVNLTGVRIGDGDSARTIDLSISPLTGMSRGQPAFLIVFEDEGIRPNLPSIVVDDSVLAEQVAQLRRELDAAREYEQAVSEEHEAVNEELKSANEEILASNEELQSTNEELKTAKEDMQAANEELETVNKEMEFRNRELRRVNDDLNSLLLGVNVPVVVIGRDLRIRRLTAQAGAAFGLDSSVEGRPLRDVRFDFEATNLVDIVGRVIDTLESTVFEARDSRGRWYSVRVRPYESGDNRIEGAVLTAIDIDAIKRAETARQELEAKLFQTQKLECLGVMAGGVAHDLNNLLTPVIGYSELARDVVPAGSQAFAFLDEVRHHTQLAVAVVQQLLSYSGKSHREVGTTDLSLLVRNLDTLLIRAASTKAEVRFVLTDEPLPVAVDATQIAQVIMNLVTNAAEAMTAGHGIVTIRTTKILASRADLESPHLESESLREGPYAVLEVSDNGSGMSEATIARMFDPFFTTKFTGRGLGLAAVVGIIRGHRGTIHVQSVLGVSTAIRFLLPLSQEPITTPGIPMRTLRDEWIGSGCILIVDDENNVRRVAGHILSRVGFTVLEAVNGDEALTVFRKQADEIVAVLVDLTMPGLSGLDLAAALRQERPGLPILVMSGYSEEEVSAAHAAGLINGFIRKPFAPGAMMRAVRGLFIMSSGEGG